MPRLTDSINSVTSLLVAALVAGVAGTGIGYTVGYNRGMDAGIHYFDDSRAPYMRDQYEAMKAQGATLPAVVED